MKFKMEVTFTTKSLEHAQEVLRDTREYLVDNLCHDEEELVDITVEEDSVKQ